MVKQWQKKANCDHAILCFSSPDNFRRDQAVLPSYKSNRTTKAPAAFYTVVEALEKQFRHYRIPRLEADDVMGILATGGKIPQPVIVSPDKDMGSIPGVLVNPTKDTRRKITPAMADVSWLRQVLTGDPGDGFKGCPGIGPKKADAILESAGLDAARIWEAIVRTYEGKSMTEDDAIRQARCARISRAADYDEQNRRIRLWHPRNKDLWLSLPPVASS